jgi:hypothetical protein
MNKEPPCFTMKHWDTPMLTFCAVGGARGLPATPLDMIQHEHRKNPAAARRTTVKKSRRSPTSSEGPSESTTISFWT